MLNLAQTPKTCLACSNYAGCDNKRKGFNFKCDEFEDYSSLHAEPKKTRKGLLKPPPLKLYQNLDDLDEKEALEGFDPDDFDLKALMKRHLKEADVQTLGAMDISEDVEFYGNFIQFATEGLDRVPYAKQIEFAAHLFGEICWNKKCTDANFAKSFPTKASIDDIYERVTFLEHGHCPKCGSTIFDFVKEKKQRRYNELIVIAGQRCIVGNSRVTTTDGLKTIKSLAALQKTPFKQEEWTVDYDGPPLMMDDGEAVMPSKMHRYVSPTMVVRLENGLELQGTYNHPVMVKEAGFVELGNLKLNEEVVCKFNTQVFARYDVEPKKWHFRASFSLPPQAYGTKHQVLEFLKSLFKYDHRTIPIAIPMTPSLVQECLHVLMNLGIACTYEHKSLKIPLVGCVRLQQLNLLPESMQKSYSEAINKEKSIVEYCNMLVQSGYVCFKITQLTAGPNQPVYDFTVPGYDRFIANSIVNHNSGKSFFTAFAANYTLHRFLMTKNIHKLYRIDRAQTFTMNFVAPTFSQAYDNLYKPFSTIHSNASWFEQAHEAYKRLEKKSGLKIIKVLEQSISYGSLIMAHAAAADFRSLRGYTRCFAAFDEIDLMISGQSTTGTKIRMNPDETHKSMSNSLSTVRTGSEHCFSKGIVVPEAYMINITSPTTVTARGWRLLEESKHPQSVILGRHYTTFEVNPNEKKNSPRYLAMKETNPVEFWRDFMAVPQKANNAFITNPDVVLECIGKHANAIVLTDKRAKSGKIPMKSAILSWGRPLNPDHGRLLALDAGASKNSFAGCLMRFKNDGQDKVVVDGVFEVIPEPNLKISLPSLYKDVISKIIARTNVRMVISDRWQSLQMLQGITQEFNIPAETYVMKKNDFVEVYNGLSHRDILLPRLEPGFEKLDTIFSFGNAEYPLCFRKAPMAHFVLQSLTVEDQIKSVEKSLAYTDDIWRAVCIGFTTIFRPEVMAQLNTSQGILIQNSGRPKVALLSQGANQRSGKLKGVASVSLSGGQIGQGKPFASARR